MLSQRWRFKNAKYKNLGENLYNKKKLAVWLVNQHLVFKITSFDLLGILYRICYVCLSRKISSQKKGKERKIKVKIQSLKIMIYVENIN